MKELDPNSFILLPKISLKVKRRNCPDSSTFPFTHNTWSSLLQQLLLFPQFKSKNSIYKLTSRHQFIIDLKWLIRLGLEYLTWCESRLQTLLFFLMTADPPSSLLIQFFLVNPFPTRVYFTYNPQSGMGSWNFGVSLLISKNRYKNSLFSFFT